MRKFLLALMLGIMCFSQAQNNFSYSLESVKIIDNNVVLLVVNVESSNKNMIERDAKYAALKIIMFDGLPETKYSKPLLPEGEIHTIADHPDYFDKLYNTYSSDFIKGIRQLTKYKKGPGKSTQFEIVVDVIKLRRDLEKNKIMKKFGL